MRGTYVASNRLDLRFEWMECIGRNLITRVLISRDTYAKHNVVDVWAQLLTSPALPNLWLFLGYDGE